MLQLAYLYALIVGQAGVLASSSCAASHCTQSEELAQASAFCSAYESIGIRTSTSYPHIVKTPAHCCLPCAAEAKPTMTWPPSFKEPEPSSRSMTTPAPSPPACLGSHVSKACRCLSITSSTSTLTYSNTITMTGPFYASRLANNGNHNPYLKKVEQEENVQLGIVTLQNGAHPGQGGASELWLDQFGRLFDSDPPTIPFSVPNAANANSNGHVGAFVEQVNDPSGQYADSVTMTCVTSSVDCPLDCTAPGYGNSTGPPGPGGFTTQNWLCKHKWYLSSFEPPNCTTLNLVVRPKGFF